MLLLTGTGHMINELIELAVIMMNPFAGSDVFFYAMRLLYPVFFAANIVFLMAVFRWPVRFTKKDWPVYVIILFQIINLLIVAQPVNNLQPPALQQLYQSERLIDGDSFYDFSERGWALGIMISVFDFLTPLQPLHILVIFGFLSNIFTVFLLFHIVRDITGNRTAGMLAALVIAFSGTATQFSMNYISSNTLAMPVFVLLSWALMRKHWKMSFMLSTILVFLRTEFIIMLPFALIVYILSKKSKKDIIWFVICYLMILPNTVMLHDYRTFGNDTGDSLLTLGDMQTRISSIYTLFQDQLSLLFLGACITMMVLIWKRPAVHLVLLSVLAVYVTFTVYQHLQFRFFISIFGLLAMAIGLGWNNIKRYCMLSAIVLIAVMFTTSTGSFSKESVNSCFYEPSLEANEIVSGNRYLLYGTPFFVNGFQNYFDDPELGHYSYRENEKVRDGFNISEYDYVVFFYESTLEGSPETPEFQFNIPYELITQEDGRCVHVFRRLQE